MHFVDKKLGRCGLMTILMGLTVNTADMTKTGPSRASEVTDVGYGEGLSALKFGLHMVPLHPFPT